MSLYFSGEADGERRRRRQRLHTHRPQWCASKNGYKTLEVLTLNPTARAVWEALDGQPSVEEIAEAFEAVFPDIDMAALRSDIIRTIDHFISSGLALKKEDAA